MVAGEKSGNLAIVAIAHVSAGHACSKKNVVRLVKAIAAGIGGSAVVIDDSGCLTRSAKPATVIAAPTIDAVQHEPYSKLHVPLPLGSRRAKKKGKTRHAQNLSVYRSCSGARHVRRARFRRTTRERSRT